MKSQSTASLPVGSGTLSNLLQVTAQSLPDVAHADERARAFAEPLLGHEVLDTGENTLAHADGMVAILRDIGGSPALQAASFLTYTYSYLQRPQEVIAKAFGESFATLAVETTKLMRVQSQARQSAAAHAAVRDGAGSTEASGRSAAARDAAHSEAQTENVRKMLLAFSRDLRVVLLRLASRLQTLRHFAATKQPTPRDLAAESLHVFAPLANRLGIWQIKWEMEDLAFRFLEPEAYRDIARSLDEKRVERESNMAALREDLQHRLREQGIAASVQGRPKHIYSIVKKMRGKNLPFDQVFDVRALRVIVPQVADCYATLSWVHEQFAPVLGEYDDYIAKPKPNGYQSLHTVVRDAQARPIEIQIRTGAMHEHAEHGVAAHWAYKEAGTKGYAGVSASSAYDAKIAVLRQLLAWERDLTGSAAAQRESALFEDRIYVLTPDAKIVELPQGATPVDFAYAVHTSLGHRCRGARVDGAMVPLHTPLQNGQTVEVTVAKEGATNQGPSRDWLNPELGFLVSHRARAKVRAWFNAQAAQATTARGREAVEKLLQREGKTAVRLEDLASQLGFKSADALFETVGKDELPLRQIELVLRPPEAPLPQDEYLLLKQNRHAHKASSKNDGGVLVVGMDSLLTQLARCCKPAPPDAISGFVTREKGVSVHRSDCRNFEEMATRSPDRVIPVDWGLSPAKTAMYPVDVFVEANDRQGLLRDISEVFAREKVNVIGVKTQSVHGSAFMTFTVEVADAGRLNKVLALVAQVAGVDSARRR